MHTYKPIFTTGVNTLVVIASSKEEAMSKLTRFLSKQDEVSKKFFTENGHLVSVEELIEVDPGVLV